MADTIDDLRREIALLRANQAPLIFCNGISTSGLGAGVGNMTLTNTLHVGIEGKIVSELTTVAHLRFPLAFIPMLRQALDEIDLLAKPAASGQQN